jgi:enamine deaminase RidA (YjgF/YER057c/UK114 family)
MTTIARLNPNRRSSSVVVHGNTVYLAGQVGVAGESAREQTATILASVDRWLREAGTDKSRLLQATILLADMADFEEMNKVWEAWIDPANPPARATSQAVLALPEYKVEIVVIAAR